MKKYLYFQPEYVSRFKCDGSRCNAHCCKRWRIDIDTATYKKYSRIKPKEKAKEITSLMRFDSERNLYAMNLDRRGFCPLLTKENLCKLQLEYGEDFLSKTCTVYPRQTYGFGEYFERSLTLSCPVTAKMVLFAQEPLKFEWIEVPEKIHSKHGKIPAEKIRAPEKVAPLIPKLQSAVISIMQRRTLSLDQRLVALCFFIDKLNEIHSPEREDELPKLIAAYESEEFLAAQVPLMIQSVEFNAEKFIRLMMELFESFYGVDEGSLDKRSRLFLDAVIKTLQIKVDANNQISFSDIAANYKGLDEARKKFLENYSTFLENYLVNEFFYNLYPYKPYVGEPFKNFSVFLMLYKVFELFTFSMTYNNLSHKIFLLDLTDWYSRQVDHNQDLKDKIFKYIEDRDDVFDLMETLLQS